MRRHRKSASLLAAAAAVSLAIVGCAEGTDDEPGNGETTPADDAGQEITIGIFEGWDEGIAASYLMGHVFEDAGYAVNYEYADVVFVYEGVAGGADVILIPEIPFNAERVMEKIRERERIGRRFSIIVVAEGAYGEGESPSYADKTGRYGGIAERLAREIEEHTGKETRTLVLGHIQRGGSPIAYDRNLALRFGAAAVRCIASGSFGTMVALQGQSIRPVPLHEAIQGLKTVPLDGDNVITARQLGVELGD